jgi:Kef-type K+ transport system membrane component KefB
VSQVGLVLYMFLVGVEFNVDLLRRRLRSAAFVSLAGILTPFILGSLLPLYFIFSGLNTRLDLLISAQLIAITLLVILVACLGKGIDCWAAARISGENNREAMALGMLMNTRGLMELILLNIGLQHGIITPTLFSIMVSMAVITTLMASPLFEWVYRKLPKSKISMAEPATPSPA